MSTRLFLAFAAAAYTLPGYLYRASQPALAAAPAAANTYLVNSTADAPDSDPANGICATSNGTCTLRAAIMQADFDNAGDTIILPAGLYLLTRVGNDDSAVVGDLDISSDMTIQGAGPGATIIDGNGGVTGDRVFQILASAKDVRLSDLTIRNGEATAATSPVLLGGGIYWDGTTSSSTPPLLQLSDVLLEKNTAQDGGGLYAKHGQVQLDDSRIWDNTAANSGGGMRVVGSLLTIQDSKVYSNTAYEGGGLWLSDITDGHIERSEIYSNTVSGYGGALSNSASNANPSSLVTLEDSSLHDNHAAYNGGGIDNYASLVISDTVLDKNTAGTYGGGIMIYQAYVPTTMLINHSTLSRNSAQYGGGIYYNDFVGPGSKMTVENSTLSGNSVSHDGGGLYAIGQARVSLLNATIAGNQIHRFIPNKYAVHGGGLVITTTAVITAENTLIGNNVFNYGPVLPKPNDCFGPLHSLGYNLIEDTTNCNISGTIFGNVTGKDPILGPLQNNGGLTPTQALLTGSPAVDRGTNSVCPGTDQRGLMRPFDGDSNGSVICDIGAYEAVSQVDQTIGFAPLPNRSLLESPEVITATDSSGLPVSFSTSTPVVCTVSGSSLFAGVSSAAISLTGGGDCTITASQAGDATFNPATPVTHTFSVNIEMFLPVVVR